MITQLTYNSYSQGLAVQSDLKTVVVGLESPSNTTGTYPHSLMLLRYNVDGSLDSTFGSGGEVVLATNTAKDSFTLHNASVAIQPDGKIVVATNTATENSGGSLTSCNMLVLRFNTNGSLDTSFGQNGETVIHLPRGWPRPTASPSWPAARSSWRGPTRMPAATSAPSSSWPG